MLALFEVLSFKGWLDVRDVLIKAVGPVSRRQINVVCILMFKMNALLFSMFHTLLKFWGDSPALFLATVGQLRYLRKGAATFLATPFPLGTSFYPPTKFTSKTDKTNLSWFYQMYKRYVAS